MDYRYHYDDMDKDNRPQVATDVSTEVALIGLVTVFIYAITSIIY